MVSEDSLDGFKDVFGRLEGQTERESRGGSGGGSPSLRASLFRVFFLRDLESIRVCVSDFRAQTWQADFSVRQLQNLRDEVGIGGTWKDFLAYVRTALASESVKLILGGAANAAGGHDFKSGVLVAQKAKGTPRLSLPLSKKQGPEADESKSSISFGLHENLLLSSSALAAEKEKTGNLRDALSVSEARTEKVLQQMNSSNPSFLSRKKQKSDPVHQFPVTGNSHLVGPSITQVEAQDSLVPAVSPAKAGASDAKDTRLGSAVAKGPPISRPPHKNKRRGTTIGEEEDS